MSEQKRANRDRSALKHRQHRPSSESEFGAAAHFLRGEGTDHHGMKVTQSAAIRKPCATVMALNLVGIPEESSWTKHRSGSYSLATCVSTSASGVKRIVRRSCCCTGWLQPAICST